MFLDLPRTSPRFRRNPALYSIAGLTNSVILINFVLIFPGLGISVEHCMQIPDEREEVNSAGAYKIQHLRFSS